MDEVRSGQKSKVHQENCLYLETGGVEYVAQMYLKAEDFVSVILEWALVDAMIYARILDFANSRKYFGQLKGNVNGQLIDGPMLLGINERYQRSPITFITALELASHLKKTLFNA